MSNSPFITLGSKGTSLPRQLTQLKRPLQIGANGIAVNGINWSRGRYKHLGKRANGWVSEAKAEDPFWLLPLDQALVEKRVVRRQIAWISNRVRFAGEAFFPATWKPGDPQPLYVAVRASGWNHGCVERERNNGNRGRWVGIFDFKIATKSSQQNSNMRKTSRSRSANLQKLETELDAKGEFEVADVDGGRVKALRNITLRRGRPKFRRSLLRLYGKRCAVSNTSIVEILEAAHIRPYDGSSTDKPQNGLLLRADLHTLFDLGLFAIDPKTRTVVFSRKLKGTAYDREFGGKKVRGPIEKRFEPSVQALSDHFRQREP